MPVPFEALLPYAIIVGMFAASGAGLATTKWLQNDWKTPRHNTDQWDRQSGYNFFAMAHRYLKPALTAKVVMARDARLTGKHRGQGDSTRAPSGFDLTNPWSAEPRIS
jgi:hypothetical protein